MSRSLSPCGKRTYLRDRQVMYKSLPPKPKPSARSDVNTSVLPSGDSAASESLNGPFTTEPRFTGVDQTAVGVARVDAQRSRAWLPGRLESRITSTPSARIVGRKSFCGVFSSATGTAVNSTGS